MTKPITKSDDVVEIYFESGSARIRLKDRVTFESLHDDQPNRFPLKRYLEGLKNNI